MFTGTFVFRQLMNVLSRYEFERCVVLFGGDRYMKSFSCWQQFLCLSFGQLTFRASVRSIVLCLNAQSQKLYHLGFTSSIKLSTLCDANEQRNWRIYEAFAKTLLVRAQALYRDDDEVLEGLTGKYYALDSTTIDLCLSVFPWAHFRDTKAAVKAHTLLDLRGNLPTFILITDGTVHDVNVLDVLPVEPGACYIVDRGYVDYGRLHEIGEKHAFFITRAKSNMRWERVYSRHVDRSTGLRCDQTIRCTGVRAKEDYPDLLRRVKYVDIETDNTYAFLTNNFDLTALQVAMLYKMRWEIELFFKWMKGHLKIRTFWGESENAVRTQIWVAVCAYLAVAIVRKELRIDRSMYEILQILSVTALDKIGLTELFSRNDLQTSDSDSEILNLELRF